MADICVDSNELETLLSELSRLEVVLNMSSSKIRSQINMLSSELEGRQFVKANKINPRDKEDAKVRTDLQYDVLLTFDEIWTLMDIASDLYSIESEKIEKWSSIMLKAEETVHAWRKANVKGYADLYGD